MLSTIRLQQANWLAVPLGRLHKARSGWSRDHGINRYCSHRLCVASTATIFGIGREGQALPSNITYYGCRIKTVHQRLLKIGINPRITVIHVYEIDPMSRTSMKVSSGLKQDDRRNRKGRCWRRGLVSETCPDISKFICILLSGSRLYTKTLSRTQVCVCSQNIWYWTRGTSHPAQYKIFWF